MEVVGGVQGKKGYYALHRWSTGILFRPAMNPEGHDIPDDVTSGIMLNDSMPRIPKECWTAMIRLFIYCVEKDPRDASVRSVDANNEVCVVFAANYNTGEVIVAAMPQVVGPARVVMDRTRGACNLITGEYYASWPPKDYAEIGDCHSHNRMGAFFSGVDDSDDRGLPGIHMVCGAFERDKGWHYRIAASVVADKMRFKNILYMEGDAVKIRKMEYTDLADIAWSEETTLHPDVLKHVHIDYPADWKHEEKREITVVDWKKTRPLGYDDWPDNVKEEYEKWVKYGYWGSGYHHESSVPNSSRGAEKKPDEERSLIEEYYDAVFKDTTGKDLPGQTLLFDVDFDSSGELTEPKGIDPMVISDLKFAFRGIDAEIESLLMLMPDEYSAMRLLGKYLDTWGFFNPISVKKKHRRRKP